jgi:hypothetical protein
MSFGARAILGIFAAIFGIIMAAAAPNGDKAPFFYGFAALCFAISIACVAKGRVAQFCGGVIATGILSGGTLYLVSMLLHGDFVTGRRSDQSVVNALRFLGCFGLPSAIYIWRTRFGFASSQNSPTERLAVEYDEREVRVRVLERLEPAWNQSFEWSDVKRVCFKDEGAWHSDILFIYLKSRDVPVFVLVEARGGSEFVGALTDRGLFPEAVWRKAVAETSGGLHCWPPAENR